MSHKCPQLVSTAFEGFLVTVNAWFCVLMINRLLLKMVCRCCVTFFTVIHLTTVEVQFCGREPKMFLEVVFFYLQIIVRKENGTMVALMLNLTCLLVSLLCLLFKCAVNMWEISAFCSLSGSLLSIVQRC